MYRRHCSSVLGVGDLQVEGKHRTRMGAFPIEILSREIEEQYCISGAICLWEKWKRLGAKTFGCSFFFHGENNFLFLAEDTSVKVLDGDIDFWGFLVGRSNKTHFSIN